MKEFGVRWLAPIKALSSKHKNELKWSGKCRNGKINEASPTSFCVTLTQFCHSHSSHGHFSGKDYTLRVIVTLNEINLVSNVFVHR